MRRVALLLIPILVVTLSLSALAQERDVKTGGEDNPETLKLTINGGWKLDWVHFTSDITEVYGGDADAAPESKIAGYFYLDFHTELQDNIDINVRLKTQHLFDGTGKTLAGSPYVDLGGLGDAGQNVDVILDQAYIQIAELFDPAVTLGFGMKPAVFDVRGSGNPMFLALGECESPWANMNNSGAYPGIDRGELHFAGLYFDYVKDTFSIAAGIVQMDGTTTTVSAKERVFFFTATFEASEGIDVGVIFTIMNDGALGPGNGRGDEVMTFGGAVNANVATDINVFGDLYFQTGDINDAPSPNDVEAGGLAFQVGVNIAFPGENPAFFEGSVTSISGADSTEANEDEGFLSYENNDDMLIFDSNEYGMDLDQNVFMIKAKGGIELVDHNITLIGKIAMVEAEDDSNTSNEDGWGLEFDATIEYAFNDNAKVYFTFAMLTGADIHEAAYNSEDGGMVFLFGTEAGF